MGRTALFSELNEFMRAIGSEKTAAASKKANVEPGGYTGETTHPVKSVDDNTQAATEGARSSENTGDVKKTVPGGGVDSTSGNTGTQADVQQGQGVKATATGEDPSVEDAYKSTKEDPGTTAPMKADDGKKYGSYSGKPFGDLYKQAEDQANEILAAVAVEASRQPKTASAPSAPTTPVAPVIDERTKAAQTGYNLAAAIGATPTPEQIKKANAEAVVRQFTLDGFKAAELVVQFENSYIAEKQAQLKKAADDSSVEGETHEKEKKPEEKTESAEGGGGGESEGGGGGGGGGGLEGLFGGGGGGGAPPDAGGGMPPGGGGGMGGGDNQAAAHQLLMALMEMGITPEMLLQGAQGMPDGGMGGGGGGMGGGIMPPPGGGGGGGGIMPPPPGGGGGMPPGMEVAAAAKQASVKRNLIKMAEQARDLWKREVKAGRFRVESTKTAQERQLRDQVQTFVREILGANK